MLVPYDILELEEIGATDRQCRIGGVLIVFKRTVCRIQSAACAMRQITQNLTSLKNSKNLQKKFNA